MVGRGTWPANRRRFYDELYYECCNYFDSPVGARREAMGALSGVAEPARPSGRCKGGHSPEPVHNAGDEQIMGLQNLLKDL